ncbi:MAG: hypothetical protein C0519_14155 [Hyphomicrobium sp.]|nr:hypothetical protein [Hyphomicrobium sp.]PPD06253.1 MAG: hypothetical protein CTY28_14290 [Hyphomicrobium sp.]
MQNLTVKNVVLAFVALNVISVVTTPLMFTNMTAVSTVQEAARSAERKATHDEMVRRLSKDQGQASQSKQPAVVKVLDLPDSETLRFNETTFVDLGWRQTAGHNGEWVGHIGSDAEYLPLSAEQIAGILKEAQLKSLPLPPAPRAVTTGGEPATAPPAAEEIDLAVSESLRNIEKAFGDFDRQPAAGKGAEWVDQLGSDAENLPFSSDHIAGLLKDDLQPLALPPVPPAVTPREKPAPAPPASNGIDLLGFIPILLGIFFMMYIRYRITRATLDAAQSATGMIQRALSDLFSSSKATAPAKPIATQAAAANDYSPAAVKAAVKKSDNKKKGTVVRPAPGLFGFLSGAR